MLLKAPLEPLELFLKRDKGWRQYPSCFTARATNTQQKGCHRQCYRIRCPPYAA